jgi:hypothetical protein
MSFAPRRACSGGVAGHRSTFSETLDDVQPDEGGGELLIVD